MWPWGHLALGYLCYAGYRWGTHQRSPGGWPVLTLAFATQFPDLVDKPLAYWFRILPEGRALTHSLLVVVPLCVILILVSQRYQKTEHGVAFSIGLGSHLIGDALGPITNGAYGQASFLIWPLLPLPEYEATNFLFHARKLGSLLLELNVQRLMAPSSDMFVLEVWLSIAVLILWAIHGMPPMNRIRDWRLGT